jgi:hypothetical protein
MAVVRVLLCRNDSVGGTNDHQSSVQSKYDPKWLRVPVFMVGVFLFTLGDIFAYQSTDGIKNGLLILDGCSFSLASALWL